MWLISPTLGLFILLLISTIHFGHSDLAYIASKKKYLDVGSGTGNFIKVLSKKIIDNIYIQREKDEFEHDFITRKCFTN